MEGEEGGREKERRVKKRVNKRGSEKEGIIVVLEQAIEVL